VGGKLTAEWTEEAFDRLVQVNLKGTWLCMRAELEQMVQQGTGSIVNTASLAGLTGFRTTAGYAASKHGVVGLTKTAAIEYAPTVRINCVCPGGGNPGSAGHRARLRQARIAPASPVACGQP
jgi:NAD(P)-dependent dehydrogenase (short-subunit alcohol dehydrogenase family)